VLPDPAAPATVDTVGDPVVDGGTCAVSVAGDAVAAWNGRVDVSGASYGPWISAATQEATGEPAVPIDDTYFTATCVAAGDQQLTFTANGSIPRRPAVYRFRRVEGVQSANDLMQVLVRPTAGGELWTVADSGRLTISAFDSGHVAGQFEITIAPLGEDRPERATVTGTFDFRNTTG
jgi:hypothetical protein